MEKLAGVRLPLESMSLGISRAKQASLMLSSRSSINTHALAAVGLMKSAVLRKVRKAELLQDESTPVPAITPFMKVLAELLRTRGICLPKITTEALSAGHLNTRKLRAR